MKVSLLKFFLLFSCAVIFKGNLVISTSYDYSASNIEAR
ncbi:unnamed protein product, partial [Musa textilis]